MPHEDEISYWIGDVDDADLIDDLAHDGDGIEPIPMLAENDGTDGRPIVEAIPMLEADDGSDGTTVIVPLGPEQVEMGLHRPQRPIQLPEQHRQRHIADVVGRGAPTVPLPHAPGSGTPPSIDDIMGGYLGSTPRPDERGGVAHDLGADLLPVTTEQFIAGMRSLGFGGTTPEHWNYGIPMTTSWAGPGGMSSRAKGGKSDARDMAEREDRLRRTSDEEGGAKGPMKKAEGLLNLATEYVSEGEAAAREGDTSSAKFYFDVAADFTDLANKKMNQAIQIRQLGWEHGLDSPGDVDPQTGISVRMQRKMEAARLRRAWQAVLAGPTISGGQPIDPAWDVAQGRQRGAVRAPAHAGSARGGGAARGGAVRAQRGPVTPFEQLVGPGRIGFGGPDPHAAINDPFFYLYDPPLREEG